MNNDKQPKTITALSSLGTLKPGLIAKARRIEEGLTSGGWEFETISHSWPRWPRIQPGVLIDAVPASSKYSIELSIQISQSGKHITMSGYNIDMDMEFDLKLDEAEAIHWDVDALVGWCRTWYEEQWGEAWEDPFI